MCSCAMRVSAVSSCVLVRVIVVMLVIVPVRIHLCFGVCNMNGVLALMVTMVALHGECSVRADQHFDMLTDAHRQRAQ